MPLQFGVVSAKRQAGTLSTTALSTWPQTPFSCRYRFAPGRSTIFFADSHFEQGVTVAARGAETSF